MNVLSPERRARVIACLADGVSVRATERMTETDKKTILRLLLDVGEGCERLHRRMFRDLHCASLELDEQHSIVAKKTKNLKPDDGEDVGEQWTWSALDVASRAVVAFLVGKRTAENAHALADDLRARVLGKPTICSDGLRAYVEAIDTAFASDGVHFAQLVKQYSGDELAEAKGGYVRYKGAIKVPIFGEPNLDETHTSYIERQNLTSRTHMKRLHRRTLCFSKSLRHHRAAVALNFMAYNTVRVHRTLRCTPAMQLGVLDELWSIADLVERALAEPAEAPPVPIAAQAGGGARLTSVPMAPGAITFATPDGRRVFTLLPGGKK